MWHRPLASAAHLPSLSLSPHWKSTGPFSVGGREDLSGRWWPQLKRESSTFQGSLRISLGEVVGQGSARSAWQGWSEPWVEDEGPQMKAVPRQGLYRSRDDTQDRSSLGHAGGTSWWLLVAGVTTVPSASSGARPGLALGRWAGSPTPGMRVTAARKGLEHSHRRPAGWAE